MQNDQLKLFHKQFKELSAKLDKMQTTNETICTMLNIGTSGGGTELFGIGGTSKGDNDELTRKNGEGDIGSGELMTGMLKFEEESRHREESLQQLLIFLENQSYLLDCTPSIWPIKGFLCSSFGFRRDPINRTIKMHEGYDIANSLGTPVHATADGAVIFAGVESGYGNVITVDHGYGITTNYAHLSVILVHDGDRVKRGQKIGLVGSTGRSIGAHLHYEVRINGVPVDPGNYLLN